MRRNSIGKRELETGIKRLNISLSIKDFEDLLISSEVAALNPTTLAQSWVATKAREESKKALKAGYVPSAQRGVDLFGVEREKKRIKKRR